MNIALARAGRRALSTGLAGVAILMAATNGAQAADSAVILLYHRFGDGGHASTNIRLEQFEAHLEALQTGDYTVLPVPEIIAAIRGGTALPDRTVGITIDDAYLSTYIEAWPRLREAGLPFTLFVATDPVDGRFTDYMSWDQIRELRDAGVVIGSQTASHPHMAEKDSTFNAADLERSSTSFEAQLGAAPTLFAYPYGEASAAVIGAVQEAGFTAAFGQHSGALHQTAEPFYMPRFALNENFGDIDRFRMVASALPIAVEDVTPADPSLTANPPAFGFTLAGALSGLDRLACYASGQGETELTRIGPRIEARVGAAFSGGRARINCTAPAGEGRWRWFGMQYYVPTGQRAQ